jgi:RNA polymerase sigma factor (sigma-70 family)
MSQGDRQALNFAYQRYAGRLHAYAWRLLGDADDADAAVQDAFHLAGWHAGELRDPHRLRPWLYAIVRYECQRRLRLGPRRGVRETPLLEADGVDPVAAMRFTYAVDLVRAAMATLTAKEHELAELATRHGLTASEIGAILDVSPNRAHARTAYAAMRLESALDLLTAAADGRCRRVRSMLVGWSGQLSGPLQRRLAKHVGECETCLAVRPELPSAASLLAKYASLPFVNASARLTARPDPDRQPRWNRRTGFPQPPVRVARRALTATAVLASVAVLIGGTMRFLGAPPTSETSQHVAASTPTGSASVTAPTDASPTSSSSPSAVPTITPTPEGESTPSRAPVVVPAVLTVQATGAARCGDKDRFVLAVTATAGGDLRSATLTWQAGDRRTAVMTVSGRSAYAEVQSAKPRSPITWWVTMTTTDGRSASTPPVTTPHPCV